MVPDADFGLLTRSAGSFFDSLSHEVNNRTHTTKIEILVPNILLINLFNNARERNAGQKYKKTICYSLQP